MAFRFFFLIQISKTWLDEFNVERIEIGNCLKSQEVLWIITGVSIVAFALGTFLISFVVHKLVQRRNARVGPYNKMTNNSDSPITSPSTFGVDYKQSSLAYKNASSAFEEVEF